MEAVVVNRDSKGLKNQGPETEGRGGDKLVGILTNAGTFLLMYAPHGTWSHASGLRQMPPKAEL